MQTSERVAGEARRSCRYGPPDVFWGESGLRSAAVDKIPVAWGLPMLLRTTRCLSILVLVGGMAGPVADLAAQQPDMLPGGSFEFGAVVGFASFASKSEFESCPWYSARAGHRFNRLAGNPRIQMGFRAGWETCITEHPDVGRVDLIHVNAAFLFGYRTGARSQIYWVTGLGEMLADNTPGTTGRVLTRFVVHGGPGGTLALSRHLVLDLSVYGILFEDYMFGDSPAGGTTLGIVPNLLVALQI